MSVKLVIAVMVAAAFAGGGLAALVPIRRVHAGRRAVGEFRSAALYYRKESHGSCPPSVETLLADGQLLRMPAVDPWGQPLLIICPGSHNPDGVDVISAGPDNLFGTADDVNSWDL
jgi:hypothetical protein